MYTHQVEIFQSEHIEKLARLPLGTNVIMALPKKGILPEPFEWARRIQSLGLIPIPTLPARRIKSEEELTAFLSNMDALQLKDLVVVGGNDESFGVYQDALGLLMDLAQKQAKLARVYMPGHPESVKVTSNEDVLKVLRQKVSIILSAGWKPVLISQLCLSEKAYLQWLQQLTSEKMGVTVFTGVIPHCTKKTLQARLDLCSIQRNASFHATYSAFDAVIDTYDPIPLIRALEPYVQEGLIEGLHWYGFDDVDGIIADVARLY
jgi:5,10-methylenetetrahydrofolate reductase